jgi:hypothetical protein
MIVFSYCKYFLDKDGARNAGVAYKRTYPSIDHGIAQHGAGWRLKISFDYDEAIVRGLEKDAFRVCR